MIHHIAIATSNLLSMSAFYQALPGLFWLEDKFTVEGKLRSVWFKTKNNSIIMLEESPYNKGPEALVFRIEEDFNLKNLKSQVIKQTEFTIYILDPDGNQIGYSSYPKKLYLV